MGFMPRIAGCLLLALLAVACGRKEAVTVTANPAPVKPAAAELRKVTLQSDWFPQAEHGGYYQALAKGFYAEAGLDVTILPGGPGAGIKLKLAKGDVDFAMMKSDDAIIAVARGLPFMMVAATMQHDPQAVMVHADSPVKSFADLNGRTVIANISMTWIEFVQKKYGIRFDLKPTTYSLTEFLADKDAIQQCIVTSEPFFAQEKGRRVRTLLLADSGYDCYHALVSRREFVRASPEVVRAFVHASIRGWRDYLEGDPSPADQLIRQRNADMTTELMNYSRREMIAQSLVTGDRRKGEDIGRLSLQRLEAEMQTLLSLKVLDTPIAIASAATVEFLPK